MRVRICKEVEIDTEVSVDTEDIQSAIAEALAYAKENPRSFSVGQFVSACWQSLNSLTDEQIGLVQPASCGIIASAMRNLAERFERHVVPVPLVAAKIHKLQTTDEVASAKLLGLQVTDQKSMDQSLVNAFSPAVGRASHSVSSFVPDSYGKRQSPDEINRDWQAATAGKTAHQASVEQPAVKWKAVWQQKPHDSHSKMIHEFTSPDDRDKAMEVAHLEIQRDYCCVTFTIHSLEKLT